MPAAIQIKTDETNGRLSFSRNLILGSEYSLSFVGIEESENPPLLVLFDCDWKPLAKSTSDGTLKLNTIDLVKFFDGRGKTTQTIHAYVYVGASILGTGMVFIHWSPLSFEFGDPVNILGLSQLWAGHIQNTQNPHNVTAEQTGAAPVKHTHVLADISDFKVILELPNGDKAQLKITEEGGAILPYWERL